MSDLDKIARKFQADMLKMGLGVEFRTARGSAKITEYLVCDECGTGTTFLPYDEKVCPDCLAAVEGDEAA